MPFYIKVDGSGEKLAHLAVGDWELPSQIEILELWLLTNPFNLVPAKYIAVLGFTVRENACGGGAILSPNAMSIMGRLGIKLY